MNQNSIDKISMNAIKILWLQLEGYFIEVGVPCLSAVNLVRGSRLPVGYYLSRVSYPRLKAEAVKDQKASGLMLFAYSGF